MPTRTPSTAERLSADDRREVLLDAAKDLLTSHGPESVTMGSVAEHGDVTRALVYKHFDNRDDLLVAVYRREASALDRAMRREVVSAGPGLEARLRALVGVILDSTDRYGPFFGLLRDAASSNEARADRRGWDRRTVDYFASLIQADTGLDERSARAATAVLLTPLQTLRNQVLHEPGQRDFYADTYVDLVLGGVERLATRRARR